MSDFPMGFIINPMYDSEFWDLMAHGHFRASEPAPKPAFSADRRFGRRLKRSRIHQHRLSIPAVNAGLIAG
jgi:hypothetical protein